VAEAAHDVHTKAWAKALAQEQAHQKELLATFRGELAAFARECAATLVALDAVVGGLGNVAQVLDAAQTGHRHAGVVLDVARRLPKLRQGVSSAEDVDPVAALGEDGDAPPRVVQHARELLGKEPSRDDRELLKAIVDAAGVRARIEELLGPAPVAALAALSPLAGRIPRLSTAEHREGEQARKTLAQVLGSSAKDAAAGGFVEVDAAASLADSLRAASAHANASARAAEQSRITEVIAKARAELEQDLSELRTVLAGAQDAPAAWRRDRELELDALTEEVREKLERLERVRGWLLRLVPRVQLVARALGTAEKIQAVEGRFSQSAAVTAEASRLSLLLDLSTLWAALAPDGRAGRAGRDRQGRRKWLLAAAVFAVAAGGGTALALALGGGSKSKKTAVPSASVPSTAPIAPTTTAPTSTSAPLPPAPKVNPIEATFSPVDRATFYTVSARSTKETPTYRWTLRPPVDNPTCRRFGPVTSRPNQAVWHHADTDGCSHRLGPEHLGTVTVVVTTPSWSCAATFTGTESRRGPPPQRCLPR
jgi:hypothetical protein